MPYLVLAEIRCVMVGAKQCDMLGISSHGHEIT